MDTDRRIELGDAGLMSLKEAKRRYLNEPHRMPKGWSLVAYMTLLAAGAGWMATALFLYFYI